MALYPKIDDESILLDNDCKRMLRRTSKKIIIDEVLEKLFNEKKTNTNILNESNEEPIKQEFKQVICLYQLLLNTLGCDK
tara:strand:+ start:75 stop:314 length:240 start_codon:yes stop_codon:yes gene_type:complete